MLAYCKTIYGAHWKDLPKVTCYHCHVVYSSNKQNAYIYICALLRAYFFLLTIFISSIPHG